MTADSQDPHRGRRREMIRLLLAQRRVASIKGLAVHAVAFVLVMALLAAINWATHAGGWWVQWPLMGWGIGLLAHYIAVHGIGGWLGPSWEERRIEEEMSQR